MKYVPSIFFLLLIVSGIYSTAAEEVKETDLLIFYNGTVITMDEKNPEAEAIVLAGNKIIYVGSNKAALSYDGKGNELIDLKRAAVFPGFTDAHMHLVSLGKSLVRLNLVGTTSKQKILEMVKQIAEKTKPGEWIIGRGWDQNDWEVKEFPRAADLDAVVTDSPVYLTRIDGHAAWVNSKALELAGINEETPDP